jgi:hypothetical protein
MLGRFRIAANALLTISTPTRRVMAGAMWAMPVMTLEESTQPAMREAAATDKNPLPGNKDVGD